MGVDAEVGAIQLDAFAVDLDDRAGGRHVLQGGRGGSSAHSGILPLSLVPARSATCSRSLRCPPD